MRRFDSGPRLQFLPLVGQGVVRVGRATVSESVSNCELENTNRSQGLRTPLNPAHSSLTRAQYDAGRDLNSQIHAHAVLANATQDAERSQWMALHPVEMLRVSPYARPEFYRELAGRLRELGYD